MVKRTPLTDGSGLWFDEDKAESWSEDRHFDGSNQISVATGSQWEHERLYRTPSGHWIMCAWSQRHGTRASYTEIDDDVATKWLVQNGHDCAIDLEL